MKRLFAVITALVFVIGAFSVIASAETLEDNQLMITGYDYTMVDDVDAQVGVYFAGEKDRTLESSEFWFRYSWLIICDADGKVVEVGNNLVTAEQDTGDAFQNELTIPAGGFLVTTLYNDTFNATKILKDFYDTCLYGYGGVTEEIYNCTVATPNCPHAIIVDETANIINLITVTIDVSEPEESSEAPVESTPVEESPEAPAESEAPVESEAVAESEAAPAESNDASATASESNEEDKGGCGSAITATAIVMTSLLGLAIGFRKKN